VKGCPPQLKRQSPASMVWPHQLELGTVVSVSNGCILGPCLLWQFQENLKPACSVPVFAKRFPQLSSPILNNKFRAWYMKYAALHGASFCGLQYLISLKLSKRLGKYSHCWFKNDIFAPPLAEF